MLVNFVLQEMRHQTFYRVTLHTLVNCCFVIFQTTGAGDPARAATEVITSASDNKQQTKVSPHPPNLLRAAPPTHDSTSSAAALTPEQEAAFKRCADHCHPFIISAHIHSIFRFFIILFANCTIHFMCTATSWRMFGIGVNALCLSLVPQRLSVLLRMN